MNRNTRRRLTLQLTPLLDMLLTVIFLQYLAIRESERETNEAAAQVREQATVLSAEVTQLREQNRSLEASRGETEQRLEQAADRQRQMGKILAAMFQLSDEELKTVLDIARSSPPGDTPEKLRAIRDKVRELGSASPGKMVQQLLTMDEIRKRCDVWELHLDAESVATLETGDRTPKFRINLSEDQDAEIERFGKELVSIYRGLPQPKSLVIILLTYDRGTRLTVSEGVAASLPKIVDQMRQASGGLTRFEFADLGVRLD